MYASQGSGLVCIEVQSQGQILDYKIIIATTNDNTVHDVHGSFSVLALPRNGTILADAAYPVGLGP